MLLARATGKRHEPMITIGTMKATAIEVDQDTAPDSAWVRDLDDEATTERLAGEVAALLEPGDLVTLTGGLGSGKTTFARALVRMLVGDPDLEVPSPTFSLLQVYETARGRIVHADLYRIERPSDLTELGFDEACEGAYVLLEWPERARSLLPEDRLDICFALDADRKDTYRSALLTGFGSFAAKLANAKAIENILASSGWGQAERDHLQGDASTRSYERLFGGDGRTAILMIAPKRPDGPPLRYGKPYSAIARLGEDVKPFVAIDRGLRSFGFSAPEIYATDLTSGLVLLEDLGNQPIACDGEIVEERYACAIQALAHLHGLPLPDTLPVEGDETYRIPPYDVDALSIEIELLLDWYVPHHTDARLASGARSSFVTLWRKTVQEVLSQRQTWTLRDYHSPNLIWLPERQDIGRVGILDFQDCVLGAPAYDVVSLLQDARVDVTDDIELRLLARYVRLRQDAEAGFDVLAFTRAYAILGAQRATKILGIFARLAARDGKPAYLVHVPRVAHLLAKNLAHPALADLAAWYEAHVPGLVTSRS
jgi:tRNA threonylcarbamoyl adenosine modification protein YjeE